MEKTENEEKMNHPKFAKLVKKGRIDINDFSLNEVRNFEYEWPFIVMAKDTFLSGWGQDENKAAWQCVVCWTPSQRIAILESFKNDKTFRYPQWMTVEHFLKSYKLNAVYCIKNANHCHAWNNGIIIKEVMNG